MKKINTERYVVECDDSEANKKAVFDKLVAFLVEHDAYTRDHWSDNNAPNASVIMGELAEKVFRTAKVKCPKCGEPYNNDEDLECGCPRSYNP